MMMNKELRFLSSAEIHTYLLLNLLRLERLATVTSSADVTVPSREVSV